MTVEKKKTEQDPDGRQPRTPAEWAEWSRWDQQQALPQREQPAGTDLGRVAFDAFYAALALATGQAPVVWEEHGPAVQQAWRAAAAAAAVKLEVLLQEPACVHNWQHVREHGPDGSVWGCTKCPELQIRRLPDGAMW